jgi:DNA-binding MarR family transcriptional regulator
MGAPARGGTLLDDPFIEVTGDGFVFADPAEGVLEPGLNAITQVVNADWDKEGTSSPSGVLNCLMANNPAIECDAEQGTGKRIKTRLTGRGGMDLRLQTSASEGITEYFTFGKTSNLTGARITGLTFTLGTGTGDAFEVVDATDPATTVLWDQGLVPRFQLPDGLFGGGGQEATGVGFFDGDRATLVAANTPTEITTAPLTNTFHVNTFGSAVLDNSMIPDGMFWDASTTGLPDEEPVLIAWYHTGEGTWVYGNLGTDTAPEDAGEDFATLDLRLTALAERAGMTKQSMAYLVDGLVAAGHLASVPDPADGRARILRLTPKGEGGLAALLALGAEAEARLAGRIGAKRAAKLRRYLELWVAALEADQSNIRSDGIT